MDFIIMGISLLMALVGVFIMLRVHAWKEDETVKDTVDDIVDEFVDIVPLGVMPLIFILLLALAIFVGPLVLAYSFLYAITLWTVKKYEQKREKNRGW